MTTLGHLITGVSAGIWTLLALALLALVVGFLYSEGRAARHRMERSALDGYRTLLTDWRALAARPSGRRAQPGLLARVQDRTRTARTAVTR